MASIDQLSYCTMETNVISALPDKPNAVGGLTASQLKAKFDAAAAGIKSYLNDTLVKYMNSKVVTAINSIFSSVQTLDTSLGALSATSDELVAAKHTHANKALLDSYAQDATPTEGSANVVTSDGLYKAIPRMVSSTGITAHSYTSPDGKLTFAPYIDPLYLREFVYPVGSIYMSVNSTSPATLFGGTWARLKDCFLLAAGDSYGAGTTGGEATHTLTVDEMPSHRHSESQCFSASNQTSGGSYASGDPTSGYTGYTGGGKAHNNMPPYLAVYVWKRTY